MLENAQAPRTQRPSRLDLIALAACGCFGAMQKPDEVAQLLAVVKEHQPRTILEIGTANGGMTWALGRVAHPDATIVTVDTDEYHRERNFRSGDGRFAHGLPGQTIKQIKGDSHEVTTAALIGTFAPFDLAFIDGDHTYEGVTQDWEWYGPMVAPNGLVCFHDICEHAEEEDCHVDRLWSEIRTSQATQIITPPYTWGGIGIIIREG